MNDEPLRVDCHECKDLEFARNLAAQMRDGYGRHNSNRTFRDARRPNAVRARRATLSDYLDAHVPYDAESLREALREAMREASGARVVGRVGDRAMRCRRTAWSTRRSCACFAA